MRVFADNLDAQARRVQNRSAEADRGGQVWERGVQVGEGTFWEHSDQKQWPCGIFDPRRLEVSVSL